MHHAEIPRYLGHEVRRQGRHQVLFLIRELVPGVDLQKRFETHRYESAEIEGLLLQMLDVLGYLHGLTPPIIHRDLKPSNVVTRPNGLVAIVDLGSVRDTLATLGGSTVAGTFGYMAPEQMVGDATPASDIYGLGALCVHLATRQPPHTFTDHANEMHWQHMCTLDDGLAQVIAQMVEPDLAKRLDSVEAVRNALGQQEAPAPDVAPQPVWPETRADTKFAETSRLFEPGLEPRGLQRWAGSLFPRPKQVRAQFALVALAVLALSVAVGSWKNVDMMPGPTPDLSGEVVPGFVAAQPVKTMKPSFPHVEGVEFGTFECEIGVKLDDQGEILTTVTTISEECPRPYGHSARDAVNQWTFEPATQDGKAVGSYLTQKVTFKLSKDDNVYIAPPDQKGWRPPETHGPHEGEDQAYYRCEVDVEIDDAGFVTQTSAVATEDCPGDYPDRARSALHKWRFEPVPTDRSFRHPVKFERDPQGSALTRR